MYRRFVFRIQIITNCIPLQLQFKLLVFRIQLHCWNQWITWRYFCFSSLFVLSHQQHLVRTKRVWFGTFALVWMQPPHFDAQNKSAGRVLPVELVSVCFETNLGKGFGRNRPPLNSVHYGNYCLISGNSKTSSTLSDRRVKMSRGSTWSQAETECLLDIWKDTHIKRMLEDTHKNANAFNTFSTRMREKEFNWSTTVWNKSSRVQPAGHPWLFNFTDAFLSSHSLPLCLSPISLSFFILRWFYRQHLCT